MRISDWSSDVCSSDLWCRARVEAARHRLARELPADASSILVNHWPLRRDLVRIPRVPRFTPWCGTTATEDWHIRYRAHAVVTGHLHTRRSDVVDGRSEEHTSELQSLMRISYAVFCLKQKTTKNKNRSAKST